MKSAPAMLVRADLSFGDRELAEENQRLRRQLAHALGQL